jgi:PAS domain S-box-containing protein
VEANPSEDAQQLESSTATALLGVLDRSEVFRLIGDRVHAIAGGALVLMTEFDPRSRSTTVRYLGCEPDERRRLVEVLGREPVGWIFAFPDEARRRWRRGELSPVPGGIPDLVFGRLPRPLSDRLTLELRVDQVLGMSCAHEDDVLGALVLVTRTGAPLRNRRLIEALVAQAGLALKRLRAEEARKDSEERARLILETTSDAVWIITLEGVVAEVNDAGCAMTGYSRAELVGMPVSRIEAVETPEEVAQHTRLMADAGQSRFESRHRRKDGSVFDADVTCVYLAREGGRLACFVRDITERKRVESALREADARKSEFLAVLSHELRNPLAPIRNSLYLLDRAAPGSDPALRARAVIGRQVNHLARLVDDLLDVTRISRGKIQIQRARVQLGSLLEEVIEDQRALLAAEGLHLELAVSGGPLWVEADPARIAQVVGNLLNNASKFTPRGGRVTVSLERDPGGETATLRVRDTGIGISAAALGRLFHPFVQGDGSIERTRGGLGLGLALVKGLVDLHGGRVEARSDGEGRGAEFTVHLPLERREAATRSAAAPAPEHRAVASRRVLIIEDNPDAANTLREVLQLAGHSVEVAYTGPDGVDRARAFAPEVVLCDIGLPGMDGYSVARALRAAADGASAALLVALSGYAQPEDVARAREAGFAVHMAKPPDLDTLTQLISEA